MRCPLLRDRLQRQAFPATPPPPSKACLWTAKGHFPGRSEGVAAIVCETTENTVRRGSCDGCLAIERGISVGLLRLRGDEEGDELVMLALARILGIAIQPVQQSGYRVPLMDPMGVFDKEGASYWGNDDRHWVWLRERLEQNPDPLLHAILSRSQQRRQCLHLRQRNPCRRRHLAQHLQQKQSSIFLLQAMMSSRIHLHLLLLLQLQHHVEQCRLHLMLQRCRQKHYPLQHHQCCHSSLQLKQFRAMLHPDPLQHHQCRHSSLQLKHFSTMLYPIGHPPQLAAWVVECDTLV